MFSTTMLHMIHQDPAHCPLCFNHGCPSKPHGFCHHNAISTSGDGIHCNDFPLDSDGSNLIPLALCARRRWFWGWWWTGSCCLRACSKTRSAPLTGWDLRKYAVVIETPAKIQSAVCRSPLSRVFNHFTSTSWTLPPRVAFDTNSLDDFGSTGDPGRGLPTLKLRRCNRRGSGSFAGPAAQEEAVHTWGKHWKTTCRRLECATDQHLFVLDAPSWVPCVLWVSRADSFAASAKVRTHACFLCAFCRQEQPQPCVARHHTCKSHLCRDYMTWAFALVAEGTTTRVYPWGR